MEQAVDGSGHDLVGCDDLAPRSHTYGKAVVGYEAQHLAGQTHLLCLPYRHFSPRT